MRSSSFAESLLRLTALHDSRAILCCVSEQLQRSIRSGECLQCSDHFDPTLGVAMSQRRPWLLASSSSCGIMASSIFQFIPVRRMLEFAIDMCRHFYCLLWYSAGCCRN